MILLGKSRDEANEYAKVYVEAVVKIGELLDPDVKLGRPKDEENPDASGFNMPKQTKSDYRKIARINPNTRLRYYDVQGA